MPRIGLSLLCTLLAACAAPRVAVDGSQFTLSGKPWVGWGFNYDHDSDSRLIEDYWTSDWERLAGDFREMKALGANLVRIHLQLPRFMTSPAEPNPAALERLARLLDLAEELDLRLDLTGLCAYRKADTPAWYADAPEAERWAAQARFWEAVAGVGAGRRGVFCYTLMNEPVSPRAPVKELWGGELGGFRYVENLTLDPGRRDPLRITREWMDTLIPAIRRRDPRALVTCGAFFLFDTPGSWTLGGDVERVSEPLDFISVHLYPKAGKVDVALDLLRRLAESGKPVLIQETFPLSCGLPEYRRFLDGARGGAAGWISFYWGTPIDELKKSGRMKDALLAAWLEFFRDAR